MTLCTSVYPVII